MCEEASLMLSLEINDLLGIMWGNGECYILRDRKPMWYVYKRILSTQEFFKLAQHYNKPNLLMFEELSEGDRYIVKRAIDSYILTCSEQKD